MALVTNDKLQLAANSAIGGNIVAIMLRQAIRLKSLKSAAQFKARRELLGQEAQAMQYEPPSIYVAGVPVSVRKQEVYTSRAEATQHACESGARLTDHVIIQPKQIDCEFEVTNWVPYAAQHAQTMLEELFDKRERITLLTQFKSIDDMVMTSLQCTNASPVWGSLHVRASFQQVKLIQLEAVKLSAAKTSGGPRAPSIDAASDQNNGSVVPKAGFFKSNAGFFSSLFGGGS